MALNIMRTNAVEDSGVAVKGEGEAVSSAQVGFPDVTTFQIALAFHLLCPQRTMPRIVYKKAECFFCTPFHRLRKPLEVSFEAVRSDGFS